jgi:hypothetical protein
MEAHGWGHCLTLRCAALRQNLLLESCQEIRPVGLVMNNRLLVGATSGEVGEGVRVFRSKMASHDRGASGKGGPMSSNDPISSAKKCDEASG